MSAGYKKKFHRVNDEVDIKPRSFYELFGEKAIYQIPAYQRPYSWGKKEVEDLIGDIEQAVQKNEDWFMGPIFTASGESEHDARHEKKTVNLLDGQQRITTLVLISRILIALEHYDGGIDYSLLGELEDFQGDGVACSEKIDDFKESREKEIKFLKDILFYDAPGQNDMAKFQTDISCREDLQKWILNVKKIRRVRETEETATYDKYRDLNTSSSNDFQITKKTLNQNISLIYDYFEGLLKKGNKSLGYEGAANGIVLINHITKFITRRLYFIHIPLVEKNDILDIFESINNRGKKLNLTDIIKFKTIKSYINESAEQEKVNNEWSKLYKRIETLSGVFKDSDDFLEKYINCIGNSPNGYTTNSKRLEVFTGSYSSNYLSGMKKVNHVLEMVDFVLNGGLVKLLNEKQQSHKPKGLALVRLVSLVFNISENSKVLFMGYFNNVHGIDQQTTMKRSSGLEGFLPLLIFLWQFIKYSISVEIYADLKANIARVKFCSLAQAIDTCSIYDRTTTETNSGNKFLLEKQKMNGNNPAFLKNLIFQQFTSTKKRETTLLLFYFQFLYKLSELDTSSRIDDKSCDHIVPQTWHQKACWKNQIQLEWNDINSDNFNHVDINHSEGIGKVVVDYIKEELWNEESAEDSFVQLLGNKMYLLGATNSKKGNKCWVSDDENSKGARDILTEHFSNNSNSSYLIPTYKMPHEEEKFGLYNIISRTIFIADKICKDSNKKLNSF